MPPAQSPSRQVARQKSSAGLSIQKSSGDISGQSFEAQIAENTRDLFTEGRDTFRFDTFGDEDFWGGALQLHQAIEGAALGGVGPGITPRAALDLGLKVDGNALHGGQGQLQSDRLDLDSPAGTLALLKANAIVGLTGFFNADGSLKSVGIQCALCHSTVDNSVASGIGHRLAQQVSHGVVTGTNVSGATLLPNAYGLAGFNQHTWTGAWGTVTCWNAFVANLEMHGKGRFFDPRLNNPAQFPIAAANGFGDLPHISPDDDRITSKLAALHFYQLALPAPTPRPGIDFDEEAAERGDELFSGKAGCNNCHVEPLWTNPGWNLHKPSEIGIDSFEADRAPDHTYKTMNLAGLFVRENGLFMKPANKGRYFHDGRFATLGDVVDHYNIFFKLGLDAAEKHDLVEYLKSLPEKT
jgi:hypothetical protein